jgi:uncharacterized protein YifE (UPF0438 family)
VLSALDLVAKQEHGLGLEGGNFSTKEALVLVKEEECTKMLDRGQDASKGHDQQLFITVVEHEGVEIHFV